MTSPPQPTTITTERLTLDPLRESDADEMASVLADDRLHEFIGDHPLTLDNLRARYAVLVAGSGDPDEIWLNWIVRRRSDVAAVGTVQATIWCHHDRQTAAVAWVIGVPWQNQGFASESARAVVDWLKQQGIQDIAAHIHPAHRASEAVATKAGLHPTDEEVDGERIWRLTPNA